VATYEQASGNYPAKTGNLLQNLLQRLCPCPKADREAMRLLIDEIAQEEPVCDDCLFAFWERLFAGEPAKRVHH
jgi:hypothetical protein